MDDGGRAGELEGGQVSWRGERKEGRMGLDWKLQKEGRSAGER
jgi:hypothetical protein